MNLPVVSVCHGVGVDFPLHVVLLHIVPQPSDDGAVVALHLTIGLWVVRRSEDISDPQNLAGMQE